MGASPITLNFAVSLTFQQDALAPEWRDAEKLREGVQADLADMIERDMLDSGVTYSVASVVRP